MKAPFRILGLLALLGLPALASAALQNGKIEFGVIKGKSVLLSPKAEKTPAGPGLVFEEGYRVETAAGSTSELLLSNGATLVLEPNTSLEVRTFRQVGSDLIKPGQYHLLAKEPSPSVTEIVIKRGKVIGEVRKLNPQSTFTIKTPVGVARIRGTVYTVEFSANKSKGVGNIKVSCVRGSVEVSVNGSNAGPATVKPGSQMSAQGPLPVSTTGVGQVVKSTAAVTASAVIPKAENAAALSVGDEVASPGVPKGTKVIAIDAEGNVTLSNPITIPEGASLMIVEPGSTDMIRATVGVMNTTKLPAVENAPALAVGDLVIGPGVPEGTKVIAVDAEGNVTLSKPVNVVAGTELVTVTPDSTDMIRATTNVMNSTRIPAVENAPTLSVGDEVTGPGIPAGTKVVAVDAEGNVTLNKPVNLIEGTEIEIKPPTDGVAFIPITISVAKLDPAQLAGIADKLSGGDGTGGTGGGSGGGGGQPAPDDGGGSGGGGGGGTKDPVDKVIDTIDKIIEKEQQTNPSPAGG